MFIVWDLFGGGQNSVYNALKNNKKYLVYTFDVTPSTRKHHYEIDLSQDINLLIKYFNKFPHPDIIVSSPLCQSFSSIRSMKGGGTCSWELINNILVLRSKKSFEIHKSGFTKNSKFDDVLFIGKLGKNCIDNTISLISKYKPVKFYIENPRNSLMWQYIKTNHNLFFNKCFINKTNYGEYGYLTLKPTIFLSNIKMNLKYTSNFHTPTNKKAQEYRMQIKKKTGIDIGLKCGGFSTLKNGKRQKEMNSFQTSESGVTSLIPKNLIINIFNEFARK